MFTACVMLAVIRVDHVMFFMALAPLFLALLARAANHQKIAPRAGWVIAVAGLGLAWIYACPLNLSIQVGGMPVALMVPIAAASNSTVMRCSRAYDGAGAD